MNLVTPSVFERIILKVVVNQLFFDFGTLATPRHAKINGWFEEESLVFFFMQFFLEIQLLPTFFKKWLL